MYPCMHLNMFMNVYTIYLRSKLLAVSTPIFLQANANRVLDSHHSRFSFSVKDLRIDQHYPGAFICLCTFIFYKFTNKGYFTIVHTNLMLLLEFSL